MELIPIKITIRKGDTAKGEAAMKYPAGHNGKLIDQSGIGMFYGKTDQIGKGASQEYAVTAITQEYLDEYLKEAKKAGEDNLIEVLTEAEAEKFFEDHIPEAEEIIEDKQKLEILALKAQAGIPLTEKERNAFDPTHEEKGIKLNDRKGFKGKLGSNTVKK